MARIINLPQFFFKNWRTGIFIFDCSIFSLNKKAMPPGHCFWEKGFSKEEDEDKTCVVLGWVSVNPKLVHQTVRELATVRAKSRTTCIGKSKFRLLDKLED